MGSERFARLRRLLPADIVVLGIDELTALRVDIDTETCHIFGHGAVTVVNQAGERRYEASRPFGLAELGGLKHPDPASGLPPIVWQQAFAQAQETGACHKPDAAAESMLKQREGLRARQEWRDADQLRDQLAAMGWLVEDTAAGPRLKPLPGSLPKTSE